MEANRDICVNNVFFTHPLDFPAGFWYDVYNCYFN